MGCIELMQCIVQVGGRREGCGGQAMAQTMLACSQSCMAAKCSCGSSAGCLLRRQAAHSPARIASLVCPSLCLTVHSKLEGCDLPDPLPFMPQAVPLGAKKAASVGKSSETPAALLQLPHFDGEVLRQLARKKVKTMPGKPPPPQRLS